MKQKDKRQRYESKIEIALENADNIIATLREPFLVLDKTLRIIFANQSFYTTFKVTEKDTIGQLLPDLGNRQWNVPKLNRLLKKIGQEKTVVKDYEIEHKFEHLGERTMILNASQVSVPKQRVAKIAKGVSEKEGLILLAIEDSTEKKKISEAKSRFTSMVSHELRSPLSIIKESVNLVLEGLAGNINDKQREFLDTAKRNSDRLARMINNILDFQKMESGKVKYNVHENNINDIVREVHKSMDASAKEKGLDITVELNENLPKIEFDRDKIVQVLTNLVNNAIKFTEKGGVSIIAQRDNNAVHVMVRDTGLGFKTADSPKLFQTFEQLDSVRDKKKGGTGLGLAISKEIILAHKGKIWAESEFGKGSTFHFILPIKERRG